MTLLLVLVLVLQYRYAVSGGCCCYWWWWWSVTGMKKRPVSKGEHHKPPLW